MHGGLPRELQPTGGAMSAGAWRASSGATAQPPVLHRAGAATGSAKPSWRTG